MRRGAGTRVAAWAKRKRPNRPLPACLAVALSVAALGVVTSLAAPTTAASAALPPPTTFVYTGGEQTYVVPAGVVVLLVRAVGGFGGPVQNQGGDGEDLAAYL